jgi:hypothetical protein
MSCYSVACTLCFFTRIEGSARKAENGEGSLREKIMEGYCFELLDRRRAMGGMSKDKSTIISLFDHVRYSYRTSIHQRLPFAKLA